MSLIQYSAAYLGSKKFNAINEASGLFLLRICKLEVHVCGCSEGEVMSCDPVGINVLIYRNGGRGRWQGANERRTMRDPYRSKTKPEETCKQRKCHGFLESKWKDRVD